MYTAFLSKKKMVQLSEAGRVKNQSLVKLVGFLRKKNGSSEPRHKAAWRRNSSRNC